MALDINGNIISSTDITNVGVFKTEVNRDSLVLYLDASNLYSYPRSGTVWSDLSGNGNNATMYGTVPFGLDTAYCFDFATATGAGAASSTLGFTFTSNMVQTTGDFTFSCWIKTSSTSSQIGLFSNAGGGDGYRFGVGTDGIYFLIGPTYVEGNISFLSTLSSTLWYNVTAVYLRTGALVRVYLNGAFQNSAAINASQTAFSNNTTGLVRSACCGIYNGKLATFSVYNKALNPLEIAENFQAERGRFGL